MTEEVIELGDAGGSGLINERMVDVTDGGTSVDSSVAIDRKDLLESGKTLGLALWRDKLNEAVRILSIEG